jgi:hypothetical protein
MHAITPRLFSKDVYSVPLRRSALQFQIQVSDSNSDSYSDLNLKRGQLSRIKCGIALSLFTE